MHALLSNPNWRFIIAFGASMGVGHALFRSLTENLGPIVGLLVALPSIALIAGGISLLLAYAVKRSNQPAK